MKEKKSVAPAVIEKKTATFVCGMCGTEIVALKGNTLYCHVCEDISNGSMKCKMTEQRDA